MRKRLLVVVALVAMLFRVVPDVEAAGPPPPSEFMNKQVRTFWAGDSILWGQGLTQSNKIVARFAQAVGSQGKSMASFFWPHSGAHLAGPGCVGGVNRGDDPYSGEVPTAGQDVMCQLQQLQWWSQQGYRANIVFLGGCINDIGVDKISFGTEDPTLAVARECAGLQQAVLAAHFGGHNSPMVGSPKVVIVGYYRAISAYSCVGPAVVFGVYGSGTCSRAAYRWQRFYDAFNQLASDVAASDGAADYVTFVNPGFALTDALGTPSGRLWRWGNDDEVYSQRGDACRRLSPGDYICPFASIGHPTPTGAQKYTDAIMANPDVRRWIAAM